MGNIEANGKRILIVEDEPVISRICMKTLVADGFEVELANDGLIAKDMLGKTKYDLCLIDIRTPAMNGIQLYEHLEQEHPDLLNGVILTTGDIMSPNVERFLSGVKQQFLPKPFTPSQLRTTVGETLRQMQSLDNTSNYSG